MQEAIDAISQTLSRSDLTDRERLEVIHGWALVGLPRPRGGSWDDKKLWGANTWLHYSPDLEICLAEAKRGGYSSMHRHAHKHNLFYLLSGKLLVKNHSLEAEHVLHPGNSITIGANDWHRFISLDKSVIVELYSKAGHAPVDLADIERQDVGGIAKDAADLSKLGCQESFA